MPHLLTSPACIAFLEHWQRLIRAPEIPHTTTFLDHTTPLMRSALIVELLAEGSLVRFMGSSLVARWQQDFTGVYLETHIAPVARSAFRHDLETVCHHPVGLCAMGETVTSAGRKVAYEMVILPLAVDAGRVPRCVAYRESLTVLDFRESKIGFAWPTKTRWFDVGSGVPQH